VVTPDIVTWLGEVTTYYTQEKYKGCGYK